MEECTVQVQLSKPVTGQSSTHSDPKKRSMEITHQNQCHLCSNDDLSQLSLSDLSWIKSSSLHSHVNMSNKV